MTSEKLLTRLGVLLQRKAPDVTELSVPVTFSPPVSYYGDTYKEGTLTYTNQGGKLDIYASLIVNEARPTKTLLSLTVPWPYSVPMADWKRVLSEAEARQSNLGAKSPLALFLDSVEG